MLSLRDYQARAVTSISEGFRAGHRCQMLYLPTGGGKTEIAIDMLARSESRGNGGAMVMDRRVLCDQTSERLAKYGIDHGVLMAGHWRWRPEKKIQVCTAQTIEARESFPRIKLLIVDEAHTTRSSIADFINDHPDIYVIGLSASPFTKGLGDIYSHVVNGSTTRELVDAGLLAPLRVFISKEIDMTGAKKVAGEWSSTEATARGIKITGDIVHEWVQKTTEIYGEAKKTIVFAAGVAHGEDLSRKFAEAGYNFVSISYKDDDEYKQDAIKEFAKTDSSIHGLIATDILTKGFDQADVYFGISARPFTKSFSSHVQQLGRVMRPHEDKSHATWLDHSGNFLRFREEWEELYGSGVDSLDNEEKTKKEPSAKEKEAAKCPICSALWNTKSDICPHCGHVRVRKNSVQAVAGEMEELGTSKKSEKFTSDFKRDFYQGLLGYAASKGYKSGWAYFQYIDKFGIAPAWKKEQQRPNQDVIGWVKHQAIKNAHRRVA